MFWRRGAVITGLLVLVGHSGRWSAVEGKVTLEMSSDSPAVLDAPIEFSGTLRFDPRDDDIDPDSEFRWRWSDDASPTHFNEVETSNTSVKYRVIYSHELYEPSSKYKMNLVVYRKDYVVFWKEIARNSIQFRITREFKRQIVVDTPFKENRVPNNNNTEIRVELWDPHNYLANASLRYFWFLNETNFGQTNDPKFVYTFAEPGECRVEVTVMAYLEEFKKLRSINAPVIESDNNINSSIISLEDAKSPTALIDLATPTKRHKKVLNKVGIFKTKITSEIPVTTMNVTGEVWLQHGDLMDLQVTCDGSGPWNFCWSIKKAGYNVTGNETCFDPQIIQTICQFRIVWYFRKSGESNVLLVVDNGISKQVKLIGITVYDKHPLTPLSFVVVPIVSALAAVAAIMTAIILMVTFKRRMAVEVADFDFSNQDEAEELEYKTFWERLRDSMLNAFGNTSDDVSHISSSSSNTGNSVRPPVGIHYGSIS